MNMKIVMVPSGFKECLHAEEVAEAMARGARRLGGKIQVEMLPMIDGGEGFAKAITKLKDGELLQLEVTGPVGEPLMSHYGLFTEQGIKTAVIEMAAVAGLSLVPRDMRNPLRTTTYGVGELIRSALDEGAERILIGCGDSGTSDGGAGMAQALGVRFLDHRGLPVSVCGGGDLLQAERIDVSGIDPRLGTVKIDVACNHRNILCGGRGVARVFGPQKGATPEQVEQLAAALEHYGALIRDATGKDIRFRPGSGASGGLGAGLAAFTGARLHSRFDIIRDYINMEQVIADADLVITAEGSLDFQTPDGKIPAEVARIAKQHHIPVVAIAGTIGKGANLNYGAGIDAYMSIIQKPATLEKSIRKAPKWIEDTTESVLRQVSIGLAIAERSRTEPGTVAQ